MKKVFQVPFHPFLWAIFAPLALLGNNISHILPGNSARTFLVSLLLALVLIGFFRLVLRSWHKAAAATTGFLILFFSYGHIYNLIQNDTLFGFNFGRHRFLFPLFLLVLALIIFWVARHKDWTEITIGLNLIGLAVLVFPLFQIIAYEAKDTTRVARSPAPAIETELAGIKLLPGENPPDIYYIILDTYTRADSLSTNFNYDNSSFIDSLQKMGFYVAGCSQSNFSFTDLSLASSLNFNYPQTINDHLVPGNRYVSDIYPYLYNNAVVYALHNLGYRFIALGSGYSPTEFKNADVYNSSLGDIRSALLMDGVNSFESMQLNTSAGMLLFEFSSYLPQNLQRFLSASVMHRERILYELDSLENMATVTGPKFVFVHILAPHNPFVFGPNGEYIQRKTPFSLNDDKDVVTMQDYVAGYRDQVTYLNQRVLSIADNLIQNSSQPPIIIIQGDHGVPRLPEWDTTILNAYYLPGGGDAQLYQTITPVNTFRVVLDHYFSGKLPLLSDVSCNTDGEKNPFSCVPVTDPNPQCIQSAGAAKP